jgi:hypothetical protein
MVGAISFFPTERQAMAGEQASAPWQWAVWLALATLSAWKALELAVPGVERSFGRKKKAGGAPAVVQGFPGLVGNTPMVELPSLSKVTGCTILVSQSTAMEYPLHGAVVLTSWILW